MLAACFLEASCFGVLVLLWVGLAELELEPELLLLLDFAFDFANVTLKLMSAKQIARADIFFIEPPKRNAE